MSEVIRLHPGEDQKQVQQQDPGKIRRIVSFGSAIAEAFTPHKSEDLSFDTQRRLGRYVGRVALVPGDHIDDAAMYDAMGVAAHSLEREGMINPNIPLGVRVLWSEKRADSEANQRLLLASEFLRERLQAEHNVAPYVSPKADYLVDRSAPEHLRAVKTLDVSMKRFESLLGYDRNETRPLTGELGFVAVLDSRWAGRAFRGVNIHQLRNEDGLVVLHKTGPQPEDVRFIAPSMRDLTIPSHD